MPRRRRSVYRMPKMKLKPKTVVTVGTIISFVLAGLSAVSLVYSSEKLSFWRDLLTSNLGWVAVFTPILFLLVGLVLQKTKMKFAQMNILVGLLTMLVSLMALTDVVDNLASGTIGDQVWQNLSSFITPVGAAILLIGTFFIGLAVFFNTSLSRCFEIIGSILKSLAKIPGLFRREKDLQLRTAPLKISGVDNVPIPRAMTKPPAKESAETLVQNVAGQTKVWKYPPLSLLTDKAGAPANRGDVKRNAAVIEKTLESFGIEAKVKEINGGPAVTQYALEIKAGTKITKIANLQHDIALALATRTGTVRIEAPIPGKSLVGIEVPNQTLEIVTLKSILASDEIGKHKSKLAVSLGKDTGSNPVVVDIDKMPHVLVAGTTGSGKSVLLHQWVTSLIFRNSPAELKLILIDPKRVEMTQYNNIPHLLTPVIVEPEKILSALKWAMAEMDRRYKLFQSAGVRNIQGYNDMSGFQALPYIVIVIDELADLMMFAPVEVEDAITRIAQLARATGIHLVVATQRPSTDIITGLIKANIPCRIAFNVSSMIDSRVILDQPGAEKLLGRGDMLFLSPDASKPSRIQGVLVTDPEINAVVEYLKSMGVEPEFNAEVTEMPIGKVGGRGGSADEQDDLFEEAVRTVCQYDRASASLLQRRLRIGYARAARILDELEAAGVVGAGDGAKPRDVLVRNADEYFAVQSGASAAE